MALKVPLATGNWNTAATWGSVSANSTVHASTNLSMSTSSLYSETFTAPNTTNACVGVLVYVGVKGTGTNTYDIALQQSGVDVATEVISVVDCPVAGNWWFIKFTTPFTYTTTAANTYRFRVIRSGSGAIGNAQFSLNAAATNFAYVAVDDRTGVPAATDDIFHLGYTNNAGQTATVVTVDADSSCGSGSNTLVINTAAAFRVVNQAMILSRSTLKYDPAASITFTCKGSMIMLEGGIHENKPTTSAQVHTTVLDQNGTAGNAGYGHWNAGKSDLVGAAKSSTTLWKTKYASGVGTAASPLVTVDAVDWEVGDEILVGATGTSATNYQETETRYIITKNSATSYVVSATSGGAEGALTYTHTTDAWILNVQRNVIIKSNSSTLGMYIIDSSIDGLSIYQWVRFEHMGTGVAGKTAAYLHNASGATNTGVATVEYCVGYNALNRGLAFANSKVEKTVTGLISYGATTSTNAGAIYLPSRGNLTLVDCFSMKNQKMGYEVVAAVNCTLTRCVGISNNLSGASITTTGVGGLYMSSDVNLVLNDCELHCNRIVAIDMIAANPKVTFNNLLCGTKGTNAADIHVSTDTYHRIVFNDSNFGSAVFVNNYLLSSIGTQISFHNLNDTANNHTWYTNFGIARSTGAGLADTTVRTAGSLGVRLAPEDATDGFTWEFNIFANANSIVDFRGYFRKNTAFGTDDVVIELWLPGSTVADDTVTLSDTTEAWQSVSLSANNTDSVSGLAAIKINAKTVTASAYLYADDFYNAGDTLVSTDKVTGLDTWYEGLPVSIIAPQTVPVADIAVAVWAKDTSDLTTADTTGKTLVDAKAQAQLSAALSA